MHENKPFPDRLLQAAPGVVSLLLVIGIGLTLGGMTWQLLPPPGPGELAGASTTFPPTAARNDTPPVRRPGLAVALFGELEQAASAPAPRPETPAPVTKLDLKLRGVAASNQPEEALAIIEGPDGQSLPYRVGDLLPGDAELTSIATDRVLLRRGSSQETLLFEELGPSSGRPPSSPRITTATGQAAGGTIQLRPESTARLREYLNVLPSDPGKMTELVRALPVMQDGQLQGFRLFPGRQRQLFSEVGLRRGDIITQVNGTPLNDPTRGMVLLGELGSASRVTLEIIRRGQTQTLDVQL